MSLTQIDNLREAELHKRLGKFINIHTDVAGVFQAAYVKSNNGWSLLSGSITLSDPDGESDEPQPCHYTYPDYQFIRQPINGLTLVELISRLGDGNELSFSGMPPIKERKKNINWTESLVPSHASKRGFPMRLFSAEICSGVHCQDRKLVAYDMPFHGSAFEFVKGFLGWQTFNGSSDGRRGEITIEVPDTRGHLNFYDEGISFYSASVDELSVVGAIDGEQVSLKQMGETHSSESENATDIELWLVSKTNEIVDYCSSSEWKYPYGNQTQTEIVDDELLLNTISTGESEHCEFKVYIDLVTKKNPKVWEIDKTVCAFSNHDGGKLFIGVDDEACIVGINEGCQSNYGKTPWESAEQYQEAVEKRLQESLVKNQCFSTYLIEHNENIVLVVDVQRANGLNYLLAKKEAYIRRGASSPKMTPSEIQASRIERDALGRPLLSDDYSSEWSPRF